MAMASHDVTDTNVMGDINVTPMVDVMLVLLIIFMVVTPAIAAGFQAKLPEGAHLKARPEKDDRTVIGIDRYGAYYLNKKTIPGCRAKDVATPAGVASCDAILRNMLTQEFQKHPQDKVLFVKADQTLKYGTILHAMDLARQSGARVLAAVTEQKPGTKPDETVQE
ncbi:MAG TPA: biopolymer transporter ExbD [Longimicrobiales bacterium]|nr:biopolymer transporter ExbD [Longimicrobiales bacterium]